MYVKINSRKFGNKRYDYAFLVRARWTPQGSRHEVMHNFGRVTDDEGERLKRAFQLAGDPNSIVGKRDEFKLGEGLLLGPVLTCERQWQPLGLEGILGKKRDGALLKTLVINRCVDPMSKIAVTRWYPATALPAILGLPVSEVNKNTLHPLLDVLDAKRREIEEWLCGMKLCADRKGAIVGSDAIRIDETQRGALPKKYLRAYRLIDKIAELILWRIRKLGGNRQAAGGIFKELGSVRLWVLKVQMKEAEWQFPIAPDLSEAQIKLLRRFGIEEEEIQRVLTCDFNRLYQPSH